MALKLHVCTNMYRHTWSFAGDGTIHVHVQGTEEYELLNYSDHGSVVDGVLYSCDFSDKTVTEPVKCESSPPTKDNLVMRKHRPDTETAKEKIEAARKNLRDQGNARRALEAALTLAKHTGKEDGPGEGGTRRTTYNSSVVSIPLALSRTKKLVAGAPPTTTTSREGGPKPSETAGEESVPIVLESVAATATLCPSPPTTPCLCRRSASCLVGTKRKGWEGTATLYHGSRLRFGCLQFVFSIAGRPGHSELLGALSLLLQSDHDHT